MREAATKKKHMMVFTLMSFYFFDFPVFPDNLFFYFLNLLFILNSLAFYLIELIPNNL